MGLDAGASELTYGPTKEGLTVSQDNRSVTGNASHVASKWSTWKLDRRYGLGIAASLSKEKVEPMRKLKAFQTLEEIAIDYLALAQDAKGRVNPMRRRRYEWLMKFVERLRRLGI